MTNKNEFIRTLMLLCVLFTAQGSWADDFMQKNSNYTAMMTGVNKVTFTLPTQRWSAGYNEGLQEGYVYGLLMVEAWKSSLPGGSVMVTVI